MSRPSLLRPLLVAAVSCSSALYATGCGEDTQTGDRRPIGQRPGPAAQRQLPEDHPDVGGMRPGGGGRSGAADARGLRREARGDLPGAVRMHLDSGNTAYRAGDYEAARRHYRAVLREDSTTAAGWFGVYMAERALGNDAAADSALQRAGGLGDAGSVHPAPPDTASAGRQL